MEQKQFLEGQIDPELECVVGFLMTSVVSNNNIPKTEQEVDWLC